MFLPKGKLFVDLHLGLLFVCRCRKYLDSINDKFLLEGDAHDLVLFAAVTEGAHQAGVDILACVFKGILGKFLVNVF